MKTLQEFVEETVKDFVSSQTLFTALDVSNKVKETMPFSRHREIRDCVRELFSSEIESKGYARATIEVTLLDGSKASALLYHPLVDSWDLDNKYSLQKRTAASQTAQTAPAVSAVSAPAVSAPTVTTVTPPVVSSTVTSSKSLWENFFKSSPSLFPRNVV
tara:strand:+ start:14098 stop:14577 length:480 start_codon:yes stop_codon:yes gene_type:complete